MWRYGHVIGVLAALGLVAVAMVELVAKLQPLVDALP